MKKKNINFSVPYNLWHRMKMEATKKETSINALLKELVEKYYFQKCPTCDGIGFVIPRSPNEEDIKRFIAAEE